MKIAIITLPLFTNYGGILQAYALQTTLERMGHSVNVVTKDRSIKISKRLVFLTIPKRIINRLLSRSNEAILSEFRINRVNKIVSQHTSSFINKHIHKDSRSVYDIKASDYDAFVVGSDQIWRPLYMPLFNREKTAAYLDFTKGWSVRRISYAASFGNDEWEYSKEETSQIRDLISLFSAVSVRENSSIQLCRKYLGVDAIQLLDPTMLLEAHDYAKLLNGNFNNKGNLFAYILDRSEEKSFLVNTVAEDRGLIPFFVCSRVDEREAPIAERIQPPVEKWIQGFIDADFVVTDSFHGCVFSIIFKKPFVVIGNRKRGMSRFISLLDMFSLQNHLINSASEYIVGGNYGFPENIDEKMNYYRSLAFQFLRHNLG